VPKDNVIILKSTSTGCASHICDVAHIGQPHINLNVPQCSPM